ncbi:putative transcriptional regulator, TetR family protein [Microlunatus endophyticus]|uniref:Transcriptional regulator, TetR family protein n=1 Tax=Microlunatus endophyticus TaxID=1716077 RepID=A0A917S9M7_9ACTN|nr:putative transcriptional regulator, TetR family protein [Microlunatus endophyticus]
MEQARREQITDAAVQVLSRDGFSGTSLASIATQIGVSKGVIGYHFGSKSEVLEEVVRRILDNATAFMTAQMGHATSYTDALRTYITTNIAYLDQNRDEALALVEVLVNARTAPEAGAVFAASHQDALTSLEQLLGQGQQAGEFAEFSPRTVAVIIRASIDTVTNRLQTEPDLDVAGFGEELITLVTRMIKS